LHIIAIVYSAVIVATTSDKWLSALAGFLAGLAAAGILIDWVLEAAFKLFEKIINEVAEEQPRHTSRKG
jgi:hypothetical protein